MLVNIGLTAAMHGARLHKTSRRDAMVRDPRRDRDELVRLETVLRPRHLDRDHIHERLRRTVDHRCWSLF